MPLNPHGNCNHTIGIGEQLPLIDKHKWFCFEQSSDVGSIKDKGHIQKVASTCLQIDILIIKAITPKRL